MAARIVAIWFFCQGSVLLRSELQDSFTFGARLHEDAGVVDAWEAKLQRIRVPAGDDLAELREQASKAKEAEDRAKAQQLDADNKRRELDLNAGFDRHVFKC